MCSCIPINTQESKLTSVKYEIKHTVCFEQLNSQNIQNYIFSMVNSKVEGQKNEPSTFVQFSSRGFKAKYTSDFFKLNSYFNKLKKKKLWFNTSPLLNPQSFTSNKFHAFYLDFLSNMTLVTLK